MNTLSISRRSITLGTAAALATLLSSACGLEFNLNQCNDELPYGQIGACPDPGVPDGQPWGACGPGEECFGGKCWHGTCHPCGGAGEACCDDEPKCNDGVCIYSGTIAEPNTCDTTCGYPGGPCCQTSSSTVECQDGQMCFYGDCPANPIPPACNQGAVEYAVVLLDNLGCTHEKNPWRIFADSEQEAIDCVLAQDPDPSLYIYDAMPLTNYVTNYLGYGPHGNELQRFPFCSSTWDLNPEIDTWYEGHLDLALATQCVHGRFCSGQTEEECSVYHCP